MPVAEKVQKPRLSRSQIWNMSFGFLGIQFGFALQNANMSRIFQTLGANIDDISILWVAAPATGLLVQPIIGYMSDRTWNRLGRRKPYFLTGAILASLALLFVPNSPALWVAAGLLWILDASINVSMEPFRALVADMLPEEQTTDGFSSQTVLIGIGAVAASVMPYLFENVFHLSNEAPAGEIPATVKASFYLGAVAFISAVSWTVYKTREYPPAEFRRYNEIEENPQEGNGFREFFKDFAGIPKTMLQLGFVQFFSWFALFAMWIYTTAGITGYVYDMKIDKKIHAELAALVTNHKPDASDAKAVAEAENNKKEIARLQKRFDKGSQTVALNLGLLNFGLGNRILDEKKLTADLLKATPSAKPADAPAFVAARTELEQLSKAYSENPKTDKTLSSATLSYFSSPAVLPTLGFDDSTQQKLKLLTRLKNIQREYNEGANWVGICFAVYNGLAALVAFFLPVFARYTSRKFVHSVCLVAGGIGLVSIFFVSDKNMLLVSMLGVGTAWASILAMPYAMLAGVLPPQKMGVYMGIFNFFIVMPQIIAAGALGFFVKYFFDNEAIYALVLGGISMFIAAALTLLVNEKAKKTVS